MKHSIKKGRDERDFLRRKGRFRKLALLFFLVQYEDIRFSSLN